jgi:hypothetical protein
LKASLNFLALSLVTGPTGTSNGSFDDWIASEVNKKIHTASVDQYCGAFPNSD